MFFGHKLKVWELSESSPDDMTKKRFWLKCRKIARKKTLICSIKT